MKGIDHFRPESGWPLAKHSPEITKFLLKNKQINTLKKSFLPVKQKNFDINRFYQIPFERNTCRPHLNLITFSSVLFFKKITHFVVHTRRHHLLFFV